MLTSTSIAGTNILVFTIDGDIDKAEYDKVVAQVLATIEEKGSVRFLKHIKSMGKVDMNVVQTGVTKLLPKLGKIERACVVAEPGWVENLTQYLAPLYPFPARYFPPDEYDAALAWLKSDD